MKPVRISIVSYLNSTPFVKGFENNPHKELFDLSLDIPSVCASKLLADEADIGLIPVAMIPRLNESHILSDYCIAADGKVASVLIVSNEPVELLTSVILDRESRTSVMLAKILMRDYWKLKPVWLEESGYDLHRLPENIGAVIIGNRALDIKSNYKYQYDLAEAWKAFTALPFVFACWVANKKTDPQIESVLNKIFKDGLSKRDELTETLSSQYPKVNVREYLFENIRYELTDEAKKGMELF